MPSGDVLSRVGSVFEKYKESDQAFVDLLRRVKKALESSEMKRIPADRIRPYPNQPRQYFNPATIQQMSDSIALTAQITAGMVRKLHGAQKNGKIDHELVDGERRWRGVMLIPPSTRPLYKAEVIDADDEVVQFLIAGMANFNREGHTPMETCETIKRYRKFGIPMPAIADLLGISEMWAGQIHGLRNLHKDVAKLLDPNLPQDKRLPVTAAIQVSKIAPDLQMQIINRFRSGEISLNRIRGEVIRVATKEGVEVRTREVEPRKRWGSCINKGGVVVRSTADLEVILKDKAIQLIMSTNRTVARALAADFMKARKALERCEDIITKAIQT